MNNGSFTDFTTALAAFESGIDTTVAQTSSWMQYLRVFDPQYGNVDPTTVDLSNPTDLANLQYHVHNTLGFLGKYQFGEPLLIDLGYYTPAATGYYGTTATNEWKGEWTGKHAVYSKTDFMTNVQELAIREAFAMNMDTINQYLAQAGKTIDDFLGHQFTYSRLGEVHVATVSMSGILASAHLQGPGGVAQLLLHHVASSDEYGTNILFYMDKFGQYNNPFGTAADDQLSGSDYSETLAGGIGHNSYTTGAGDDKMILAKSIGGQDTVQDFAVGHDVISLVNFPGVTFKDLAIHTISDGSEIVFPNGQTLTLLHVAPTEITAQQFVYGPYKITWNANSGDTVLDNFNLQHDLIDLNYAFASNNLALYEENGSSVIEVIGNHQRVILEEIPLNQLSAANFIKAPVDFATVHFSTNASHVPPVNTSPPIVTPPADNHTSATEQQESDNGDVFSFTWNWGARDIVHQFNVADDIIDLKNFWTSFDLIKFYDNSAGQAVIDLINLNNQTITLEGVSIQALTDRNFTGVSGTWTGNATISSTSTNPNDNTTMPVTDTDTTTHTDNPSSSDAHQYSYTWNWGVKEIIKQFDVTHDTIDLSRFWTSFDQIEIKNDDFGNTVIDLSAINNQTITLQGVSVSRLLAKNITGVTGSYSDALITPTVPPDNTFIENTSSTDLNVITHGVNDTNLTANNLVKDVFQFTWNWGSQKTISDFNVTQDKVDLSHFWTSADQVSVHNDTHGNAVIDLTALNNQTITLLGVSASDLQGDNLLF